MARPAFSLLLAVALVGSASVALGHSTLALVPALSVGAVPSGSAGDVSASVTWDGVGVGAAGTPTSAFPIAAGESADVGFSFTEAAGTPPITNASLTLYGFGLALTTESIAPTTAGPNGTAELRWSFGSLIYLTEGVYEIDAQLEDANGTTLFHQAFYVDAQAPYLLGSAILALLIVLGIVEALWMRTLLRYRRIRSGRRRR